MIENGSHEKSRKQSARGVCYLQHLWRVLISSLLRSWPFLLEPLGPFFFTKIENAILYMFLPYVRRVGWSGLCSKCIFLPHALLVHFSGKGPSGGLRATSWERPGGLLGPSGASCQKLRLLFQPVDTALVGDIGDTEHIGVAGEISDA